MRAVADTEGQWMHHIEWQDVDTRFAGHCFLAIEVTDTPPYEIVEISLIDESGQVLLNTLVRPESNSEWQESKPYGGITPESLQSAPSQETALAELKARAQKAGAVIAYPQTWITRHISDDVVPDERLVCCSMRFSLYINDTSKPDTPAGTTIFPLADAAKVFDKEWSESSYQSTLEQCLIIKSIWEGMNQRVSISNEGRLQIRQINAENLPIEFATPKQIAHQLIPFFKSSNSLSFATIYFPGLQIMMAQIWDGKIIKGVYVPIRGQSPYFENESTMNSSAERAVTYLEKALGFKKIGIINTTEQSNWACLNNIPIVTNERVRFFIDRALLVE